MGKKGKGKFFRGNGDRMGKAFTLARKQARTVKKDLRKVR